MGDQLPSITSSEASYALDPSEVQLGSSMETTADNSEMIMGEDKLTLAETETTVGDENEDGLPKRDHWSNPMEFLMSCLAMGVGLGNIWRFPFTAYNNGGGAFLIPYVAVLIFIARPIYFMELCLGQFTSCSQIDIWSCVPLLRGLGVTTSIATAAVLTYYCSINALTLFYFFVSFQKELPWTECNKVYGYGPYCNVTIANATRPSLAELYFVIEVLHQDHTIDDGIGLPDLKLTGCLLLAWIIVLFTLIKGLESSGKVAYFLALFPYVVLTIMLVQGCTLKGNFAAPEL